MARKHNTKHNRSPSNYKHRLQARGESKTPVMPSLESLRNRQRTLTEDLKESLFQRGIHPLIFKGTSPFVRKR